MSRFRIQPHQRLQEWVAEEKGYFKDEGLDYEFVIGDDGLHSSSVTSTDAAAPDVQHGAFETMQEGRACEVSSACHWAVNMASSASHGMMWGHAYSVTPSGIWVAPDSPIQKGADLADVEIAVGFHSGSHFSTLQALLAVLPEDRIKFRFGGGPMDRVELLLQGRVAASALFGLQYYIAEQHGYRRVLDTTFMIGFLANGDIESDDLSRYFRALQRAQVDIDLEPERYKHYFLNELPEPYRSTVDISRFGTSERIVFETYTREMYEKTHRWMEDFKLFPVDQVGTRAYEEAVLV